MDPISVIVGALVAGASTALKDTAGQAVKDSYSAMKTVLTDTYRLVSIQLLEKDPRSEHFKEAVKQEVSTAGAANDVLVLENARKLLEEVEHDPATHRMAANIDLKNVKAQADIIISKMRTKGPAARLHEVEAGGKIQIEDIDTAYGAPTGKNG